MSVSRQYYKMKNLETMGGSDEMNADGIKASHARRKFRRTGRSDANLISSLSADEGKEHLHLPAIDLDVECRLVPSRSKGCYHLYIDRYLTNEQYTKLIDVMTEVGLVNNGVRLQQQTAGMTCLRPEGTFKPHSLDTKKNSSHNDTHFDEALNYVPEGAVF